MKFLKSLFIMIILVSAIGYGVYHVGSQFISDKIAESLTSEIENDQSLHDMKLVVNSYPKIKKLIDEGANVDDRELPFTTKEDAIKTVVEKFGLKELQNIQTKFESGMSQNEIEELVKELEAKLTEEEILALKAIAYKELTNE